MKVELRNWCGIVLLAETHVEQGILEDLNNQAIVHLDPRTGALLIEPTTIPAGTNQIKNPLSEADIRRIARTELRNIFRGANDLLER